MQIEQIEQEKLMRMKIETKERYEKEKEERQEIAEIYKDVLKTNPITSNSNSQTRKKENIKSLQRPFSAKHL